MKVYLTLNFKIHLNQTISVRNILEISHLPCHLPNTINKLKEYWGPVSIRMVVIAMAYSLKRKKLNVLVCIAVLSKVI